MAAVTICNDFGAQKNKVSHCFHCFPILLAMKWSPLLTHIHKPLCSHQCIVFLAGKFWDKKVKFRAIPLTLIYHLATTVGQPITKWCSNPLSLWSPGFSFHRPQPLDARILSVCMALVLWNLRAKFHQASKPCAFCLLQKDRQCSCAFLNNSLHHLF